MLEACMRICYIAKHGSGGNDDEGAIKFAFEKLGHSVIPLQEKDGRESLRVECDLVLFHKWYDLDTLSQLPVPKIFWWFDLVDWPSDATLASRSEARKRWMAQVTPRVDIGLMSDGDWVERDKSGKLVVLRQGADERIVGFGHEGADVLKMTDVLFVGGVKGCGTQRASFVEEMRERYGDRFLHVEKGVYGKELAELVCRSKVVVCPDSPVTDQYWSNRIYVMAGFGACLVHPGMFIKDVSPSGTLYYPDRQTMFEIIDKLLIDEGARYVSGKYNLECTKERHLYRYRCEELIRVVKERLHV